MKGKFKRLFRRLIKCIKKPEMRILPGQLAFFLVLALIPLVALMGTLVTSLNISVDVLQTMFNNTISNDVASFLQPILSDKKLETNTIVFYLTTLFLASNGAHSMIIASNSVYKLKNKSYFASRLKAVIMTFVLILLMLFVLLVPAFGDLIIGFVTRIISDYNVSRIISTLYPLLKYPLSLFFIYFGIKLLYTMAPDSDIKSCDTTYGALFTTFGWIIATQIYSIYINNFSSYNIFYGSVSNILVLLLWIYIISYIFMMGIALNATKYEQEELEEKVKKTK